MSKPKPSVGRGRARGRLRQDGSPGISPVGLIQAEVVQFEAPSTIGRTLDSSQRQIRVHTSDEDESRLKKNPRPRSKRPEVQLYVPRGRRSQDTGSNDHYSQTKESSTYHSPEYNSSQNDETQNRNDTEITQSTKDTFNNESVVNDFIPKPHQEQPCRENDKPVPNASRHRRAMANQIYVPPSKRKDAVQTESLPTHQSFDGESCGVDDRVTDISGSTNTQRNHDIHDVNETGVGTPKTNSDIELWEVDDSIVAISESRTYHNQNKYCEKAKIGKSIEEEKQVYSLPVQSDKLNNQKYDIEIYSEEIDHISHKDENVDGCQSIDKCMPTNIQSCQIIKNVEHNLLDSDIPSLNNETPDHIDSSSFSNVVSETKNNLKDLTVENDLTNSGHEDSAAHIDIHTASEHILTETCQNNRNYNSLNLSADTVTLPGNYIISQPDSSTVEGDLQREHFDMGLSSGNGHVSSCDMSSGKLSPNINTSDDLCTIEKLEKDTSEVSQIMFTNDIEITQTKIKIDRRSDEIKDEFINEKNNINSVEKKVTLQSVESKSLSDQGSALDSMSNITECAEDSSASNIPQVLNKHDKHDSSRQRPDTPEFTKSEMTLLPDTSVLNTNDPSASHIHVHDSSDSLTQDVMGTDECNININVDSSREMSEGPSHICSNDRPNSREEYKSVCQKEDTSSTDSLSDKSIFTDPNVSDISEEHRASEKDKATESTTHGASESAAKCDAKATLDEPLVDHTGDENDREIDNNVQHYTNPVAAENEIQPEIKSEITEKGEKIKKTIKKKTTKVKKKVKKKQESNFAQNSDTTQGKDIPTSARTDQVIKSTDNSGDDESWDKIFNDDGECLDPTLMQELTGNVGKVKVKKPVINYLNYQPKEPDLDYEGMNHVIEIFDFSQDLKTEDLLSAFNQFKSKGFDIKWVDDTHALGVFSSVIAANDALQFTHPLLKVGPLSQACRQSKLKAKRAVEFLQPYKPRPETTAVVARRMLTGALGLKTKVSKEQREKEREERQKLKQAKEKKKKERQQIVDIWEGNITSNVQTEEENW